MAETPGAAQPDKASLLAANRGFYEAFQALDATAMDAVWETSERAFCVHPGWPALRGDRAVRESWRRIIVNTAEIRFELSDVTAQVLGETGIVTCREIIHSRPGSETHVATAIATNLFSFRADTGWKLFHHHAALVATSDPHPVIN